MAALRAEEGGGEPGRLGQTCLGREVKREECTELGKRDGRDSNPAEQGREKRTRPGAELPRPGWKPQAAARSFSFRLEARVDPAPPLGAALDGPGTASPWSRAARVFPAAGWLLGSAGSSCFLAGPELPGARAQGLPASPASPASLAFPASPASPASPAFPASASARPGRSDQRGRAPGQRPRGGRCLLSKTRGFAAPL